MVWPYTAVGGADSPRTEILLHARQHGLGRKASVLLRQIRTMTTDTAERKLNCIGWPCEMVQLIPLNPARRCSGWGFLLQDMRRK
jgi:hypothetical protein